MLARDVRQLKAPLPAPQQVEHPYAFGQAEVVPVAAPTFTPDDALSVVYQMCNYGAPDADLTADYTFYRVDGARRLFNRTDPQQFADADLPPPRPWDERRRLRCRPCRCESFPPGQYELEVIGAGSADAGDRRTATVAFTVGCEVR